VTRPAEATLATAGGLGSGRATACSRLSAPTARCQEYPVGVGILAPISYAVDGERYVTILAGYGPPARNNASRGTHRRGMLVAFKLDRTATVKGHADSSRAGA
jgi:hypothetical protein